MKALFGFGFSMVIAIVAQVGGWVDLIGLIEGIIKAIEALG